MDGFNARRTPCLCGPLRPHYFYTEKIPILDYNYNVRERLSRPSSANSMKSSRNNSKNSIGKSKPASEPKIGKKLSRTKKSNSKCENVQQLKHDLNAIKEQLLLLTKGNRRSSVNSEENVETKFKKVKMKCQCQEKEIERLRKENDLLIESIRETTKNDDESLHQTKRCLDEYETKLNCLYKEFMETSKIMEESKQQMCECLNKSNDEYKEMEEDYKKTKESEKKFVEENKALENTVNILEQQLQHALVDLEKSRRETLSLEEKHEEDLNKKICSYNCHLEKREKEIDELTSKIYQMKANNCKCKVKSKDVSYLQCRYQHLLHKYKHLIEKLENYKKNEKKRNEELMVLKQKEKNLNADLVTLQSYGQQMMNLNREYTSKIAKLTSENQEKETVIQCQRSDIIAKEKQVEILVKNEGRLKAKLTSLQEEIVGMRVLSSKRTIVCSEECAVNLSEELQDLINSLYEEINKGSLKDEHIQKQNQDISCLKCTLCNKEKELNSIRKELKLLKTQFKRLLQEKHYLLSHLQEMAGGGEESEECRCCAPQHYGEM